MPISYKKLSPEARSLLEEGDFCLVVGMWNQVEADLDAVEPEYNSVFSDLLQVYQKAISKKYRNAALEAINACFPESYKRGRVDFYNKKSKKKVW